MGDLYVAIKQEYLWVLLSMIWIGFQCLVHGFVYGGGGRSKIFTKEFLEENFGNEHKVMTGGYEIQKGGYPDTGSGKYSQKLSYADWYKFNCGQRIHLNYLEHIASVLTLIAVCGIFYPIVAAIFGALYIIGRQIVAFGYGTPKGAYHIARSIGITTCDLVLLGSFIAANIGIFSNV